MSGDIILAGTRDNKFLKWSLSTGQIAHLISYDDASPVYSVAMSGDFAVLSNSLSRIMIWQLSPIAYLRDVVVGGFGRVPFVGHTGAIYAVSISADYIISGSNDKTIRIWPVPW